jgi:hypothetical protein
MDDPLAGVWSNGKTFGNSTINEKCQQTKMLKCHIKVYKHKEKQQQPAVSLQIWVLLDLQLFGSNL